MTIATVVIAVGHVVVVLTGVALVGGGFGVLDSAGVDEGDRREVGTAIVLVVLGFVVVVLGAIP